MKGLLGKKLGMTQVFVDGDNLVPVTVIEAGPCVVTQVKTAETDGYAAIQVGYGETKEKRVNRPLGGHFKKAGVTPRRHLVELRVDKPEEFQVGQELKADSFAAGEKADVVGLSKGRGFSGVVKRWGFRGGPGSHGAHFHRAPGSIGAAATPSRVFKGRKLPGQYGHARVTVQGLEIMRVDPEQNLLLVKGAVPGPRGSVVLVKESTKGRKKKK